MSKNMIKKFLKNKNVIVTGADGFIGSHLTEELTKLNCNIESHIKEHSQVVESYEEKL